MNARILRPEEWSRLGGTPLPPLLPYLRPEDVSVVVVESGERIVASLAVLRATHLEGLWIDPEHRNAGVARSLMRVAADIARGYGSWAIGGAADDTMRDLVTRYGGVKLPMDSYALSLTGGV